jgi:hypothetical protein
MRFRWWRTWQQVSETGGAGGGGGGQTTGSGTGAGSPGQGAGTRATYYTPDEVNEIVEARLARERAKLEARFGGPGALEELERLRREEAERKRREEEAKGNYERALQSAAEEHQKQLAALREREEKLRAELRTDRVRANIIAAAAELSAINPDQVADLLEGRRVDMDPETLTVVCYDEHRKPAFVGGKPMTVKQLVSDYLQANPHLMRPSGTGGSGSTGGAGTSTTGTSVAGGRELELARQRVQELRAKAEKSGSYADVTAVFRAERDLAKLERELSQKAG